MKLTEIVGEKKLVYEGTADEIVDLRNKMNNPKTSIIKPIIKSCEIQSNLNDNSKIFNCNISFDYNGESIEDIATKFLEDLNMLNKYSV